MVRLHVTTLVLMHGWGFGPDIWHPVIEHLPNWSIRLWDRGYFGPERMNAVERPTCAVGHSFGAMLLARWLPDVPLVAINGFDQLCAPGGVAPRLVERMRQRFVQQPESVLNGFRRQCGAAPSVGSPNLPRLSQDLGTMTRVVPNPTRSAPVLALHGEEDAILPSDLRAKAFPGARRIELPDQGHLLPLTMPQWCAAHIRAFVR